ncbi:MAG: DsbE family thiol:disulfide interchange protein [Gammaproteobacteria bacterium]|uniref:DsbE family thiol:disulfide interchange protein n=1 Tax=SAR86 cluster bacterium TaxID=2030880 RepID=A0A520MYD9_9GAMM|nr:DsbE family thiol:disulfide interchange protein [SAR86 cluster bacterium]MBH37098.1 DsbE family thiol:disulfide interchange protein [Gammaproteobacteria bacterium]RPG35304.1 MAG: DsbE family thiol:disulfide interchange protein [Gammaproteobacteria bacterium TMED193]RZO26245.1 MAG: DsbE family thiol:disulfide interchange protein [SAR86 cluster bacterium]|tara:strand:- start:205 stop:714 length:510 start_codon:yes stop_codon:yes gene_type:complete
MKKFFAFSFFGFLVAFVYFFSITLSTPRLPNVNLQDGKTIPILIESVDLDGNTINHEALANGPILLNVWASWCIACLVEHPFLTEISANKELTLIGINYKDNLENAKKYLEKNGNPYDLSIFDYQGNYALKLGVTGAPETFLIIDGKIVKHRIGEINEKIWNDEFKNFF